MTKINIKVLFLLPEILIFFFIISLVLIWCFVLIQNKTTLHYNYITGFYETLISILPILYFTLSLINVITYVVHGWSNQLIVHNLFVYNEFVVFSKIFFYMTMFIFSVLFKQYHRKLSSKNTALTYPKINDYIFVEFLLITLFLSFFSSMLMSVNEVVLAYIIVEGVSLVSVILISHLFNISSAEAAIKYLVYSILSSAFFVGGFFFIWSNQVLCLGISSYNFDIIASSLFELSGSKLYTLDVGIAMILVSFLIKFGVFPVHFWVVDVYDGTWNFVMFLLSTAVKVVYFFFFLRLLFNVLPHNKEACTFILLISAVGSLFFSSVVALTQDNIKRLLAYTSIGQMGFVFLGLLNHSLLGVASSLFHFTTYIIGLVLFFVVYFSSNMPKIYHISDFSGLWKTNLGLSFCITLSLLSMAGIPPLVGFFSKYYIFISLMSEGYYSLTLFSILISVVSSFVYLRLIKIIWFDAPSTVSFSSMRFQFKILKNYLLSIISLICVYFLIYFIINPDMYLDYLEILCNSLMLIYV